MSLLILKNELDSPQLRLLKDDDYHDLVVDFLSEVKVLTGGILYSDARELSIQLEVVKRFLISHPVFNRLTAKEIVHAFYLNNQGAYPEVYKHYNREINAEFLGSVLLAYVGMKKKLHTEALPQLYKMLHQAPEKPKLKVTNEYMEQLIQMDYDNYRKGDHELIFYHRRSYNYLRKCGMIYYRSAGAWWKWYQHAMEKRKAFANARHLTTSDRTKAKSLKELYANYELKSVLPISEHLTVIHHMQLQRYLYFFDCISLCGINKIFEEIQHDKPTGSVEAREKLNAS